MVVAHIDDGAHEAVGASRCDDVRFAIPKRMVRKVIADSAVT